MLGKKKCAMKPKNWCHITLPKVATSLQGPLISIPKEDVNGGPWLINITVLCQVECKAQDNVNALFCRIQQDTSLATD